MTVAENQRPLITAALAAHRLGIPRARLYELSRLGVVPSVSVGRARRWDPLALEEWIRRGGASFEHGWRKEAPR